MVKTNLGLAGGLLALVVLAALSTSALRGGGGAAAPVPALPPVLVQAAVSVPVPAAADAPPVAPVPKRRKARPAAARRRVRAHDQAPAPVAPAGVAAFYPIYGTAQRTFGVNWLLLASVHQQETAFSTDATTYHGRNGADCCAGPMQFNVTNGPVSTWARYRTAYRLGVRPASYGHKTRTHPSVYDDFDSVMAAAALLRGSGASARLDASAWRAAYDYYGHDATGVDYATHVVARAIGWGVHGFCAACATDPSILAAVDAAYAAPVRAEYVRLAALAAGRRRPRG